MEHLFRRSIITIFALIAITVLLDVVYENYRYREASQTVAEYAYTSSSFSLSTQDMYFEDTSYKSNGNYINYLNTLHSSSNAYLTLCADMLQKSLAGAVAVEVVPANFNLAFLDETFTEDQFKSCMDKLIQGYRDADVYCPFVIDNIDVTTSYSIRVLSPEILRSIYGNEEDILSYFGGLDAIRYEKLMDALKKDRGVPCYEVTYSIDYSYCTSGFYSGWVTNSGWFSRATNKVTATDVANFNVKPDQQKYASENITFKRVYNVF